MLQSMQQFYLGVDSSLSLPSESQPLYTSSHTATNERYYSGNSANIHVELSQAPEPSHVMIQNASESPEVPYSPPVYRGEKQVKDDVFNEDPCMLLHNCLPLDRYVEANRAGYEAYKTTPYRHYTDAGQSILETWKTIEDRRKVLGKFHGKGYEQRRKTFSKASNAQKRIVDPSNVPEDLSHVPGGDLFLQLQTDDLHLYFCTDSVEVPILYAVTRYKNVETYKRIFEKLRETLGDYNDRVILDFEKQLEQPGRRFQKPMYKDAPSIWRKRGIGWTINLEARYPGEKTNGFDGADGFNIGGTRSRIKTLRNGNIGGGFAPFPVQV
ncbi:unnamed protein product [Cylicocyclus nassatus]|uniref:Uncharacterized protein n=1 Tax=Cylicocyclus nassatus TaxID=53992 RepID=A0AA36H2Q5_CYLNA|nr:unnamed protein product [Cylicocyclus nassatus]